MIYVENFWPYCDKFKEIEKRAFSDERTNGDVQMYLHYRHEMIEAAEMLEQRARSLRLYVAEHADEIQEEFGAYLGNET
jgi:hypothetical protein